MISCPFCGSACNDGALICPFCKVELPAKELINTYRRILERDRSFLEPGNRKKLDALAQKEFDVRQVAIAEARHAEAVEESRKREEARKASELEAEEARRKQEEFNDKIADFIRKYGWVIGSVAVFALLLNFLIIPFIQEKRLESRYKGSTVAACAYAREVNQSLGDLYQRLDNHLNSGKKFGTYWESEVDRITNLHINKIRNDFINPSSDTRIVRDEVSDFEYMISYDINRLQFAFSVYWDKEDLGYYGRDHILEENDNLIAWCEKNQG